MAAAVARELSQYLTLHLVSKDQPGLSSIDQVSLVYNFGCTLFSSEAATDLLSLHPGIPLVNHFQLVLPEYARQEGYDEEEITELQAHCEFLASVATCNIFPSFSELNRIMRLGWNIHQSNNMVISNAFIEAPGKFPPIANGRFNFIAAGRFSDYVKGADLLYHAFSKFYWQEQSAHLLIAADDQRFTEILHNLPQDSWTWLGWLDRADLHAQISAADVLIVPSRYEPFGLIAVEAMAMGTPVIAMDTGGLSEILHHGRTGWLVDPLDGSYGLRHAMELAFANRAQLPAMGGAARQTVKEEFSLHATVRQIHKLIDNVLSNKVGQRMPA